MAAAAGRAPGAMRRRRETTAVSSLAAALLALACLTHGACGSLLSETASNRKLLQGDYLEDVVALLEAVDSPADRTHYLEVPMETPEETPDESSDGESDGEVPVVPTPEATCGETTYQVSFQLLTKPAKSLNDWERPNSGTMAKIVSALSSLSRNSEIDLVSSSLESNYFFGDCNLFDGGIYVRNSEFSFRSTNEAEMVRVKNLLRSSSSLEDAIASATGLCGVELARSTRLESVPGC